MSGVAWNVPVGASGPQSRAGPPPGETSFHQGETSPGMCEDRVMHTTECFTSLLGWSSRGERQSPQLPNSAYTREKPA